MKANKPQTLPQGYIAYYRLTDWWLSSFTTEEQELIEATYQPMSFSASVSSGAMSSTQTTCTTGVIGSGGGTVLNFLLGLSSWFKKPDQRSIAQRIFAKALDLADGCCDYEHLHCLYMSLMKFWYKDRANPESMEKAIAYAQSMIAIAPQVIEAVTFYHDSHARFTAVSLSVEIDLSN